MKPVIEIQRIGSDAYSYRISAQGAAVQEPDASFDSLERCLYDAGASIGAYFSSVEMNYEGMFLGSCATDVLRQNPKGVAQRIAQHYPA